MLKKSKYIFVAILSLLILGGCREEMPSLGEASSTETSSETVTVTETSSATTTAVPAKIETETSTETSETTETTAERDEISEEQAALEKLILDNAENKEGYTIQSPLFGDFDGDGVNELVALYGNNHSEVWFASGGKADLLASGYWCAPEIVTSCGKVFIKMEYVGITTSTSSAYFLVKNSSASEYLGVPYGQDVYPYGEFGDFVAQHDAYDTSLEWYKDDPEDHPYRNGHSWKTYWYYSMGGEAYEYTGREITEEEFLKYEGAGAVLDEAAAGDWEVKSIIKRSCGIININLTGTYEDKVSFSELYRNRTLKYRGGRLLDVNEFFDKGGNYRLDENDVQTDFERFSEMIYDTAEGDENSFIRERFYGDTDNDNKNELYAYYGTDENFLLWFADENGAKKVTDDISLFYADGDVLMRNGDDYFVMKNGKSKKLDTLGAENFSVQADGSFTGYISSGYADSTRSDVIKQLYWFRYKDGKISEYAGLDITEEEFLQYGGGRAFLDEIAARGGDLVNIVRRENGIININYALHNQTITNRFFMTLEISPDNKLTDITPKNEDGTPDNVGWYLHSLSIASAK